jgi:hypothetical protein
MVRSHGVICCLVCSALWRWLGTQHSHFSIPQIPSPGPARCSIRSSLESWFRSWLLGSDQSLSCSNGQEQIRHVRPSRIRQDRPLVSQQNTDVDDFSKRANVHGTGWIRHHVGGLDSSSVSQLGVVAQPAVKSRRTHTDRLDWPPEHAAANVS